MTDEPAIDLGHLARGSGCLCVVSACLTSQYIGARSIAIRAPQRGCQREAGRGELVRVIDDPTLKNRECSVE